MSFAGDAPKVSFTNRAITIFLGKNESMKSSDWGTLSNICFPVGGILFLASVVAIIFEEYEAFSGSFAPYRELGFVGLVLTAFIFIVAYSSSERSKLEESFENPPQVVETSSI